MASEVVRLKRIEVMDLEVNQWKHKEVRGLVLINQPLHHLHNQLLFLPKEVQDLVLNQVLLLQIRFQLRSLVASAKRIDYEKFPNFNIVDLYRLFCLNWYFGIFHE